MQDKHIVKNNYYKLLHLHNKNQKKPQNKIDFKSRTNRDEIEISTAKNDFLRKYEEQRGNKYLEIRQC